MIHVSIITVSYNSEKEIDQYLSSLNKSKSISLEIIIVDNASTDQTVNHVEKHNGVVLIRSRTNLGFAKACNLAAKKAKGKYLLFLNPDTIIKENAINNLVNFFKDRNESGIIGCKVLNTNKTIQPSCGNFPTIWNVIADRIPLLNKIVPTQLIRNESYYMKEQEPDWISGVCMLMQKNTFNKVHGFDEKYFLYVEDIDFCYRAKIAGIKIIYTPQAIIYHKDMGKTKQRKPFKAKQIRKGLAIFFTKYKSGTYCFLWQTLLRFEAIMRPSLTTANR